MTFSAETLSLLVLVALGLGALALLLSAMSQGRRRAEPREADPDGRRPPRRARGTGPADPAPGGGGPFAHATDRRQEGLIEGAVRRVGLVRYDAFEDVGGRLSFSCALLDDHGTGVVMTSINGRQDTRVYAKPINEGHELLQPFDRGGGGDPASARGAAGGGDCHDDLAAGGRGIERAGDKQQARGDDGWQSSREREVTIVGQGAKLEGTVVSAGSLRIDGQVKGQVNADGDVMLSPQSAVEADIRAQNVSVSGDSRARSS